ncbi:MAG: phenylalanine--tRNA ligase subunit alpha [Cyanobacteriota bacterium]
MNEKLLAIKENAIAEIHKAKDLNELENVKISYIGRKGELNLIRKSIKDIPPEERPLFGQEVNQISKDVEDLIQEKYNDLFNKSLEDKLNKEKIDVTLPGICNKYGKLHPLTKTTNEIVDIFINMGFSLVPLQDSPEVETEYYNFDSLNFPPDHPAKDMQDTYYTTFAPNVILRSQTSNCQVRYMSKHKPPIQVINPGRVYRNEAVSSRKYNLFHQVEGFMVDKNITFGDLKGCLNEFFRQYFGENRPSRFRPSYFPFTEPSCEIDIQCFICSGKGCRVCSQSGWLEILGAGMIDPNVLKEAGIDPEIYSGFAFGMGTERLTMLKYAIDDIRLFFNNDLRFLEQF